MRVISIVAAAGIGAAVAAPASADVTLRSRIVQEDNGRQTAEVTEYRKGLKMRTDSSALGTMSVSMILDVGTGRALMLWHDSKTATEHDFYETRDARGQRSDPAVQQSVTPTSETREIAGSTCTVYRFRSSFRMEGVEVAEPAMIVVEGSTCLVRDGPGQADFVRIHRAMAGRVAGVNPMLTTNVAIAELGVPFASDMTMTVGGDAPNAERRKIGSSTMEVTSFSTASIPDSMFEIPAGYTVTRR